MMGKSAHGARGGQQPKAGKADDSAASRPFRYRAFGLAIRSEFELPDLSPAFGTSFDVSFRLRPVEQLRSVSGNEARFEFRPDSQLLSWPSVGSFLIRDGSVVDIGPI